MKIQDYNHKQILAIAHRDARHAMKYPSNYGFKTYAKALGHYLKVYYRAAKQLQKERENPDLYIPVFYAHNKASLHRAKMTD